MTLKTVLIAVLALSLMSCGMGRGSSQSGSISAACNGSGRKAANPALCSCIQQVANMTLRSGDQSRAAKFFGDPDKAHATWMSKKGSDDAFWDRYKVFGEQAKTYCSAP